jgi:hypothetical protein
MRNRILAVLSGLLLAAGVTLTVAEPAFASDPGCTWHPYYSAAWGKDRLCYGIGGGYVHIQNECWSLTSDSTYEHVEVHFNGRANNVWYAWTEDVPAYYCYLNNGSQNITHVEPVGPSDWVDQVRLLHGGMPAFPNNGNGGGSGTGHACVIVYNVSGPPNNC